MICLPSPKEADTEIMPIETPLALAENRGVNPGGESHIMFCREPGSSLLRGENDAPCPNPRLYVGPCLLGDCRCIGESSCPLNRCSRLQRFPLRPDHPRDEARIGLHLECHGR